ncbi:aromatic acid exporter family protein [Alicyclobacillus tolerans]|uniref:FUSC family protein n=1 Tax=Alicyclobacillus tolerans TaxID=90970 RepID=UPI001F373012|nr:FUSC family protein [Alicyclobacillus tolerans]MCF8565258.1 aromatic acid exporter family protein [Alicyclobacillus tolerans]
MRFGRIFTRLGLTLQVVKTALASGLSWILATHISQNHYPYFAPLAAILTSQVTLADSLEKGTYRLAGVIGGVILSIVVGHFVHIGAWSIALIVLVGMGLSTALRLNSQITSQVGVSSLLVLAFGQQSGYAIDRIVETLLGSMAAIAINAILVPPNVIPQAEEAILALSRLMADTVRNIEHLVEVTGHNVNEPMRATRSVVQETSNAARMVKLTEQSYRFTPFYRKRRDRIEHLAKAVARLEKITIQIRGIGRGIADLDRSTLTNTGLRSVLEATAECIRLYGECVAGSSESAGRQLGIAIAIAHTRASVCLSDYMKATAVGTRLELAGILTDLNRILTEVNA